METVHSLILRCVAASAGAGELVREATHVFNPYSTRVDHIGIFHSRHTDMDDQGTGSTQIGRLTIDYCMHGAGRYML